jgi:putative aminopeptidase
MKHLFVAFCGALLLGCLLAAAAGAQDLHQDLAKFVETPAVSGYEQGLAKEIRARLAQWKPQTDSLGDVIVTIGSGAPHRVIATAMDEAGYVVSGITEDGYLRLQRLPQTAPNPVFDTLYAAQPVTVRTRAGKTVWGVVAGLSTHLQPGRVNAPQPNNLDDVYVDIGAASASDVGRTGIELLDPVSIDRRLYDMGYSRLTSPAIGDRFGCAAVVETLRHLDASQIHGTLTVAFLAQQGTGARGLRRLLAQNNPLQPIDEMVYVGRLLARRGPAAGGRGARGGRGGQFAPEQGAAGAPQAPAGSLVTPRLAEGSGVLIGVETEGAEPQGFAAELMSLGQQNHIQVAADFTAPLVTGTATSPAPAMPERFAHLGIGTRWPVTPAELIDFADVVELVRLLEVYAAGSATTPELGAATPALLARPAIPKRPSSAPPATEVVRSLVQAYGVSEHEKDVHDTVLALLPAWAKTQTDASGNIWLHWGSEEKNPKKSIVFVAHQDEIGYDVRKIDDDGRLELTSRGGGISYFFAGHAALVHTPNGDRPGVIELPANWEQPGFSWPQAAPGAAAAAAEVGEAGSGGRRGPAAPAAALVWRVDVGARTASEVEALGISTTDWVTVPKKYHSLASTRANGRAFDDRVGDTALIEATWALGPQLAGRDVTFIWSTGEEIGLVGAGAAAKKLAADDRMPQFVFAIDTFVSSDSPLESKRFAWAPLGRGFVVRAVDNSNITPREFSDRVVAIARANQIPVQFGVTGGGNDGSTFVPFGSVDVGLGWPLRYSHSPGEVIDTRDLDGLARVVAALAKNW